MIITVSKLNNALKERILLVLIAVINYTVFYSVYRDYISPINTYGHFYKFVFGVGGGGGANEEGFCSCCNVLRKET